MWTRSCNSLDWTARVHVCFESSPGAVVPVRFGCLIELWFTSLVGLVKNVSSIGCSVDFCVPWVVV